MRIKRLLVLSVFLSLAACASPTGPNETQQSSTKAPVSGGGSTVGVFNPCGPNWCPKTSGRQ